MIANPEHWVVGSIFLDPLRRLPEVREIITADDFLDDLCRAAFEAACAVADRGFPADLGLVHREIINSMPAFNDRVPQIARMVHSTPVAYHARYYAGAMVEATVARETAEIGRLMAEAGSDPKLMEAAQASLTKNRERLESLKARQKTIVEGSLRQSIDAWLDSRNASGEYGVPTGVDALDRTIGGQLSLGSYVVVGASPGNGKTLFMLQALRRAALVGHTCVFYSQEMSYLAIGERLVAMMSGRTAEDIQPEDVAGIKRQAREWFDNQVIVYRHCAQDVNAIVSDMRRMVKEYNATVFAIDYLGLLHGRGKDRYQQQTDVTTRLAGATSSMGVTTYVGCQLNREHTKRTPPIPKRQDLRDSGEIEASADAIFLLRYPIKDTPKEELNDYLDKQGIDHILPQEYFEVHVAKLRNRSVSDGFLYCRMTQRPLELVAAQPKNYDQELTF